MLATKDLQIHHKAAILDTSMASHPCLVIEVPPEEQEAVRAALETLSQVRTGISVQSIVLHALRTAAEQAYFWTPEWQAKERAADEAIAEGRVRTFDTMEDMLNFLDWQ